MEDVFLCQVSALPSPLQKEGKPAPAWGPLGYSPGRVRGRYEEVDDHAVEHVQATLHHPGAEKARYGLAGPGARLSHSGGGPGTGLTRLYPAVTRRASVSPYVSDQSSGFQTKPTITLRLEWRCLRGPTEDHPLLSSAFLLYTLGFAEDFK